jgi:hypothetical protein
MMNRVLTISMVLAGLVLGGLARAEAQGRKSNVTMPPPEQRRSMGNLLPSDSQPSLPTTPGYTHRPWAYGKPPYYQQPPVTPYYVVPYSAYQPYYYGGTPYYGRAPYYVQPWTYGQRPYLLYPSPYVRPGFSPYVRRF